MAPPRRGAIVTWSAWRASFTRCELVLTALFWLLYAIVACCLIALVVNGRACPSGQGRSAAAAAIPSGGGGGDVGRSRAAGRAREFDADDPVERVVDTLTECTKRVPAAGRRLERGEYDFFAAITTYENTTSSLCSASIIHKSKALTTASCAKTLKDKGNYVVMHSQLAYTVALIVLHGGYNETSGANDLAVLKIGQEFVLPEKHMLKYVGGPIMAETLRRGDALLAVVEELPDAPTPNGTAPNSTAPSVTEPNNATKKPNVTQQFMESSESLTDPRPAAPVEAPETNAPAHHRRRRQADERRRQRFQQRWQRQRQKQEAPGVSVYFMGTRPEFSESFLRGAPLMRGEVLFGMMSGRNSIQYVTNQGSWIKAAMRGQFDK